MPMQTLVVFLLGAAGAGGLLWVFLYPVLSGERQAERRQASVARQLAQDVRCDSTERRSPAEISSQAIAMAV